MLVDEQFATALVEAELLGGQHDVLGARRDPVRCGAAHALGVTLDVGILGGEIVTGDALGALVDELDEGVDTGNPFGGDVDRRE